MREGLPDTAPYVMRRHGAKVLSFPVLARAMFARAEPVLLANVEEHASPVVRRIRKTPAEILKRYEKWKDIVRLSGARGLRLIKWFHDEALRGEWAGHRSSRLGDQHRVIYRVIADEVQVRVLDLTPHDYRRR